MLTGSFVSPRNSVLDKEVVGMGEKLELTSSKPEVPRLKYSESFKSGVTSPRDQSDFTLHTNKDELSEFIQLEKRLAASRLTAASKDQLTKSSHQKLQPKSVSQQQKGSQSSRNLTPSTSYGSGSGGSYLKKVDTSTYQLTNKVPFKWEKRISKVTADPDCVGKHTEPQRMTHGTSGSCAEEVQTATDRNESNWGGETERVGLERGESLPAESSEVSEYFLKEECFANDRMVIEEEENQIDPHFQPFGDVYEQVNGLAQTFGAPRHQEAVDEPSLAVDANPALRDSRSELVLAGPHEERKSDVVNSLGDVPQQGQPTDIKLDRIQHVDQEKAHKVATTGPRLQDTADFGVTLPDTAFQVFRTTVDADEEIDLPSVGSVRDKLIRAFQKQLFDVGAELLSRSTLLLTVWWLRSTAGERKHYQWWSESTRGS